MLALATAHLHGPHIDWGSFMPIAILGGGALIVLIVGLLGGHRAESTRARVTALVTIMTFAASLVIEIIQLQPSRPRSSRPRCGSTIWR